MIRTLVVGLLLVIGPVVLLPVGYHTTRSLVGDGLDRFTGTERVAAERALDLAQGSLDHPIQRGLTPKLQVVDVRSQSGYCPVLGIPAHQVVVRTYTLFGIPTEMVCVTCGSLDDCRG